MGDLGLIPGLGRSPGEGNSFPLQYSCLENSMDRAAWQATVHEAAKSWTQLSNFKEKKKERERDPTWCPTCEAQSKILLYSGRELRDKYC